MGVADYDHLRALNSPILDAKAMNAQLQAFGFDTTLVLDPDLRTLDGYIRDFLRSEKDTAELVFYYSGHGIQLEGQNFLVPRDAKPRINSLFDAEHCCFPLEKILSGMSIQGDVKKARLVILDACRSDPWVLGPKGQRLKAGFAKSVERPVSGTGGHSMSAEGGGLYISYATAANTFADDGPKGGNSRFTRALLKYLRQPDLEIEAVMKMARIQVVEETDNRQWPSVEGSILEYYLAVPKNASFPFLNAKRSVVLKEMGIPSRKSLVGGIEYLLYSQPINTDVLETQVQIDPHQDKVVRIDQFLRSGSMNRSEIEKRFGGPCNGGHASKRPCYELRTQQDGRGYMEYRNNGFFTVFFLRKDNGIASVSYLPAVEP